MATTRARRDYTDEEKAKALALLHANAGNQNRTARTLGIPRLPLCRWAQGQASDGKNPEELAALRQRKRDELSLGFRQIAEKALALLPGKLATASAKDLAVIAAIACDKVLLLSGEATSRSETVSAVGQEERLRLFREQYNHAHPPVLTLTAPSGGQAAGLLRVVPCSSEKHALR